MKITMHLPSGDVGVDLSTAIDLSTTLEFHGDQPNAFGLPAASAEPFKAGPFIGDTRQGGSVNCESVFLTPHGNGTHTECVGHIVNERVSVSDILEDTLMLAQVVTAQPCVLGPCSDRYDAPHDDVDMVVCMETLEKVWQGHPDVSALIIRTLPNTEEKRHAEFSGNNPVFLTTTAMTWIRQQNIKHLLVDFPSVDREEDAGLLPNHHVFWEVADGTHDLVNVPLPHTITEMVYVPDSVADGIYALTIQIPDFALDAAPSRPRLFRIG